jgi:hypothetical protein
MDVVHGAPKRFVQDDSRSRSGLRSGLKGTVRRTLQSRRCIEFSRQQSSRAFQHSAISYTKLERYLHGEDLVLMGMNKLREKLESHPFTDIGAMMEGYAQAAVAVAESEYRRKLDFSEDSINALDEIVVLLSESPDIDLDFESRLWGSYLGEILRIRYTGSWEMTQYPGGTVAVPAVAVRGSRLFPLMKVHRRLTIGDEEDLPGFYTMVTTRLGNPARVV